MPHSNDPTDRSNPSPGLFRMSVLVRLALINSIGYAASTIVPLWVGSIGARMSVPGWFGGVVATAQLAAAALFNLMTPFLFRKTPPLRLAKRAMPLAAAVYLLTLAGQPSLFVLASIIGGACLGVVLNATNRIVAGSAEVQKGYSIFLISEGAFSSTMFYSGALLSRHFGLVSVFLTLPAVTLLGTILLVSLPVAPPVTETSRSHPKAGRIRLTPVLGLLALFIFFSGQSCITASTLTLAHAVGIPVQTASAALAVAVVVGLIGAITSRHLGERFGVRGPILCASGMLALVVFAMTQSGSPMSFYLGILWVQLTTLFIVPYFFTLLARLDAAGRTASVGPAFLLAGVAVGPGLATLVTSLWSIATLGPLASLALLCSAALTTAATAQLPGSRIVNRRLSHEPHD